SETIVNRAGRTGGTFLHTSRTRPSNLPRAAVPGHLRDELTDEVNDATRAVRINVVNQRLGYLVRSGDPDALDSIVPMAFGNLALDLVLAGRSGRLVSVRNGVSGRKALQPRRRRSPCQRAVRRPILHEI
ncbi:MAG: hypothetical protein ACLFRX_01555, partial [Gemmatimonadota bacterium]